MSRLRRRPKTSKLYSFSEVEVSWLEDVKVKTVQSWRRDGSGPPYRKQGSGERAPVVYPILNLRDWRRAAVEFVQVVYKAKEAPARRTAPTRARSSPRPRFHPRSVQLD